MKTPLVIVLVIVAGMLGFLTIYSQQKEPVAQVTQIQGAADGQAAPAPAADVQAAPAPAAGGSDK